MCPLTGAQNLTEGGGAGRTLEGYGHNHNGGRTRRVVNEVTSSQGRILPHDDHNYMQPERPRNTRSTLSRHQLNVEDVDPLQGIPERVEPSTSRLRAPGGSAETTSTIVQRRSYLSRSTTLTEHMDGARVVVVAINGTGATANRQSSSSQSRFMEPVSGMIMISKQHSVLTDL